MSELDGCEATDEPHPAVAKLRLWVAGVDSVHTTVSALLKSAHKGDASLDRRVMDTFIAVNTVYGHMRVMDEAVGQVSESGLDPDLWSEASQKVKSLKTLLARAVRAQIEVLQDAPRITRVLIKGESPLARVHKH